MVPTIDEFFTGRSVFVTGGTGFMGKILVEKLVRSCPGINTLYVLVRSRRGKGPNERMQDIFQLPIFDRVKQERPGFIEKKIKAVEGDVTKLSLGLSPEDLRDIVNDVTVIFHAAASVRFDDPINQAIIMNTRGTREVVYLAKQIKNFAVLLHVSTTFCNCNRKKVDEIVYPAPLDWKEAILVAETQDPAILNILHDKYLGPFPNSYVLTKNLAERILKEEESNVPTVIYRPSIVISTESEPVEGWIDNFNGPVGLLIGVGKGVVRIGFSKKSTIPDYMPVDIAIKGMIVAAWKRATLDQNKKEVSVINSSSVAKSISSKELMDLGMRLGFQYPLLQTLWVPTIAMTTSKTYFYVNTIVKQVIPAIVVDAIGSLDKKKPPINLLKIQRKIYQASMALSYFTSKSWLFKNTNFLQLLKDIPDSDLDRFDFSFDHLAPEKYLENAFIHGHRYLMKTDPNSLPQARIRMKRLLFIHRTLKLCFLLAFLWIFCSKFVTPCL